MAKQVTLNCEEGPDTWAVNGKKDADAQALVQALRKYPDLKEALPAMGTPDGLTLTLSPRKPE